jgi:energy-coupling factor transporter ATP-binding protein EcfA2
VKKVKAPYVGIRPFEKDDWPIFFGRESLSNELLYKLETNRFVAVVGSSGSGKSSVVKAGLLPLLEDHKVMRRAEEWLTLLCRPGDDPCGSLARKLVAAGQRINRICGRTEHSIAVDLMRATLRTSDRGIIPILEGFELPATTHVLVVIDQFEELFGFREAGTSDPRAPEEAERFVSCLLESCKEPIQPISSHRPVTLAQRIWVVLTMRSDFIGNCEIFPALSKKVSESQFLVPILDPEQKRKAIIRPSLADQIEAADYSPFTFEEGLVSIIVNESGTRIDQLPLMQHALMRTWTSGVRRAKESDSSTIKLREDDYDAIGRIDKALSQHADAAFNELTNNGKDARNAAVTRRLFLLLCDVSPEGKITRRRPTVDEVMQVAAASLQEVKTVVEAFQRDNRNFIVTRPPGEEVTPSTRLDVSHEALLRQWSMLNSSEVSLQASEAPETNAKKAGPNSLWSSLKKWLLVKGGQEQTFEKSRTPRGWLAEEREAATELLRLRQDCELHAQSRGDLLDMIALTRVEEWRKSTQPSEPWAQRYLDGKGTWEEIERFISQSDADVTMARRVRRGTLILLGSVLVITTLIACIYANTVRVKNVELEAAKAREAESREPWNRLRDEQLALARSKLENPAAERADAMRHYINALRADLNSVEAARFICRSLAQDSWLRPLTPNIMAPANTSLLCAGIGPDQRIYAVSRGGMLLVEARNRAEFEEAQPLLPAPFLRDATSPSLTNDPTQSPAASNLIPISTVKVTDAQSASDGINLNPEFAKIQPRVAFLNASFSNDGTHIVVLHAPDPNARNKNHTLQVWKWSGKKYEPVAVSNIPDWTPFRNVTWLPAGQGFMLSRWDAPTHILYRFEASTYDSEQFQRKAFRTTSIQAAAFAPDGTTIAAAIVGRPDEIAMFDAYTGDALPERTVHLSKPLPGKVNQILFGPGPNELSVFSWGSPPEFIDLETGKLSRAMGTTTGDQITRVVMSSPQSGGNTRMALIAGRRIHAYSARNLSHRLGEAIKLKGPIGFASFDRDGARLLTWSGMWGSFNAVRLWSVEPVGAIEWKHDNFNHREIGLRWLPDLAEAITGQGEGFDEDGDLFPDVPTLEAFAMKYANDRAPFPYEQLWARFLEPKRRAN